jgi:hypothetical protein
MQSIKGLENQRWFIWTIILIMIIGISLATYIYYVGQTDDWGASGDFVIHHPKLTTITATGWKTYTDEAGYFSVSYPSTWNTSDSPESEDGELILAGKEGEVDIATQGLGGACGNEQYENVNVGGETFNACHWIDNYGIENWSLIYKQINNQVAVGISALANPPLQYDRPVLIEVLKGFKFVK